MMPLDNVVFWVFAPISVASAIGMLLVRNAIHAALFLVVNFFCLAVFYLLLDAPFLFAVQIIVYAGAIVVLFLFVIMLLGVDRKETLHDPLPYQRLTALALGAIALAEILFLAGHQWATGQPASPADAITGGTATGGNVERVARVLFTDFLWPFEITAALLVLAVVGSVVLARRSGQTPEQIDEHRS